MEQIKVETEMISKYIYFHNKTLNLLAAENNYIVIVTCSTISILPYFIMSREERFLELLRFKQSFCA